MICHAWLQPYSGFLLHCIRVGPHPPSLSLHPRFDDIRQERVAKYQGMNLYIKNLADTIDDDKLRAEFEPFGTITSAKCMKVSPLPLQRIGIPPPCRLQWTGLGSGSGLDSCEL